LAQLLKFTDRLDEARRTFNELLGDAAAHGVEGPIAQFRYQLAQLECWAGNWDAAMEHARQSRAAAQRIRMGAMSSEGHLVGGPRNSASSRMRSRRTWASGGSTRPKRSSHPSRTPAGTSTGPGPSPPEPGAGRLCLRRGVISLVRRPRPMRRCGNTIACPFL